MEISKTTVSSRSGYYSLNVTFTKVNLGWLLSLENPRYEQLIRTSRLRGVEIDDTDAKPLFLIYVILGTGVYARIRTEARPGNRELGIGENL